MESPKPLAPCLVGRGTVSDYRDMLRALETVDNTEYRYTVDGAVIDEGQAALVKLMADPDSATMIVNGCIFLNVVSFRFLDFACDEDGRWLFTLNGDGTTLELVALPETEDGENTSRPHLLSEDDTPSFGSLILLDEDEDEE